jgi:hypothetical protein
MAVLATVIVSMALAGAKDLSARTLIFPAPSGMPSPAE